jgi:hypothetical protein
MPLFAQAQWQRLIHGAVPIVPRYVFFPSNLPPLVKKIEVRNTLTHSEAYKT